MKRSTVASVSLPTEIVRESAIAAKELGKSRSEVVADALRSYLSIHKLRKLQKTLATRRGIRRPGSEEQIDRLVHQYRRKKRG